jgi:hypothetical protein
MCEHDRSHLVLARSERVAYHSTANANANAAPPGTTEKEFMGRTIRVNKAKTRPVSRGPFLPEDVSSVLAQFFPSCIHGSGAKAGHIACC